MSNTTNQTAKFTPGPLIVEQSYGMLWLWDSNKQRILATISDESELKDEIREMNLANFNLYAAAPELLESLQNIISHCETFFPDFGTIGGKENELVENAKSAITKATGGQP